MKRLPFAAPDSRLKPGLAACLAACFAACLAACLATAAHAQSHDAALTTPSGTLQFARAGHAFVATLDNAAFDRFDAGALTHFDETGAQGDAVPRTLVQTEAGPVLYDLRRRPPLVQRTSLRMTVKRVFWQGDEVVMQGSQGWFRLRNGTLTKLQSSKLIYH
ncbi:hypothetical protein [Paraburkholderia sp. J41]|uniref:hypothetical protein n=1 Tax=Paraburkholderia sp. J41 TaxID=2805433 RepID=UPI002AC37067|nr:hypothetical protein [Paraburkholderia sp. J41]